MGCEVEAAMTMTTTFVATATTTTRKSEARRQWHGRGRDQNTQEKGRYYKRGRTMERGGFGLGVRVSVSNGFNTESEGRVGFIFFLKSKTEPG